MRNSCCAPRPRSQSGSSRFVARLNPVNWSIDWLSYLGGSGADWASGLVLDADENIYVAGVTVSSDFPLKDSLEKTRAGPWDADAFLVKVSAGAGVRDD
jgi:hypothetical protein